MLGWSCVDAKAEEVVRVEAKKEIGYLNYKENRIPIYHKLASTKAMKTSVLHFQSIEEWRWMGIVSDST